MKEMQLLKKSLTITEINMNRIYDRIERYSLWLLIVLTAVFIIKPAIQEINTIMLIVIVETVALTLSRLAALAYTRIDFISERSEIMLASLFIGVHICTGMTVLGVYIAQF
jgi:hypothetical protein